MKILVIAAAKGGVGKTTLAAALAVAALAGWPPGAVALLDMDPQGSLTAWWNARRPEHPRLYTLAGMTLAELLRQLELEGVEVLVVDCPPGFTSVQLEAIAIADLVLVPTQPSALDLAAIETTAGMAERAGRVYRFVLNRAVFRSRLAGAAVGELRRLGRLLCAPVHQRVAIPAAMGAGLTVLETEPTGAAARELTAVWHAASALLEAPRGRGPRGRGKAR